MSEKKQRKRAETAAPIFHSGGMMPEPPTKGSQVPMALTLAGRRAGGGVERAGRWARLGTHALALLGCSACSALLCAAMLCLRWAGG